MRIPTWYGLLSVLFSIVNLNITLGVANEINGAIKLAVPNIKSDIPYSSVVKQFVYTGTKKNSWFWVESRPKT